MKRSVCYKDQNLISYAEYGDPTGYPILVQHGLIASITEHHLFERLLREGCRLVCIARSGYGESSPYEMQNLEEWGQIVSAVLDQLAIAQFDVLGISSGAPYSYAVGCRFPQEARNIYIFSGVPALYDPEVQSHWPHPIDKSATIADLQKIAYDLFFAHLALQDLEKADIHDSMMHGCFGPAQDFKLRCVDWGFRLQDVKQNVYMRHSRFDEGVPFMTAALTARMLPNCQLEVQESSVHFSKEALDDFLGGVVARRSTQAPTGEQSHA